MAQEVTASPAPSETPIPTLIPTETETETFLPTIAPTPLPTETATETAVLTETATEQPTVMLTPSATELLTDSGQPTESASPSATNTQTADTATLSPTTTQTDSTGTPTETATASATQPAFTPEPPLTLLFTDTFDTGSLILWNMGTGWSLTAYDAGQALQAVNSDEPVTFIHNTLNNAVVETHFAMSAGMVRLSLRQSGAGAYSAILAMNGQLALYRGDQVIGTAVVDPITTGTWHTLRLSAINNILRVSVDNTQGIVTEDTTPLPPGTFSFAGVGNTSSTLFVDDVSLWMPTSELQATSTPTFTVTPSATVTGEAPEPALRLIYNQSFDGSSDPFGELSRSIWPLKHVEPDYALYVTGAKRLTRITHQSYTDVVSEARFFVSTGAGQLSIRQNGTVGYTASLNANGQIELYRNGTLIDSVPVGTPVVGQWYAIRLTAIADLVRVYVNKAEFIRFTDSSPLPDGMITFNGENLGNQPLLVDDLQVWVPDEALLTAQRLAPQAQALLSAEQPSIGDYLKRNEIFISGFLNYKSYWTGNGESGWINTLGDVYVALSPDGHQIAYNCFSGSSNVCVMNVDGSGYFRVTDDLDYDNHPSWSPDGSQISFWSSREIDGVLTSGIWTINADGTNLQLLATSSQGYEPRWVGTTINNGIYYFVYGEGFYRYDPTTESNQLVANETGEGVGKSDYAVSRSGDYWLAYIRTELLVPEMYDQSILIVRNLSQGASEIVHRHTDDCYYNRDIYYPILSPDATYVTYFTDTYDCGSLIASNQWLIGVNSLSSGTPVIVAGTTESAGGYSGDWGYRSDPNPIPITGKLAYVRSGSTGKDVWIMENWTDQQTQLSDSPFADTNPELSPGGQYITFVTERFGGGKEIVVKPVADGLSDEHLLRLTDNYEITDDSPTWSPDGQQIAFYSENPNSYGINIMNADGSSKQLVFAGSNITDLSWSPVANELVYTGYDNYTDSYGIYSLDINNPVPVLLTTDPSNERHPVWSPDGEQIAFTSDTGGRYNIYVMDADGSNVQGVSTNNHNGDNVYPAWSPDGSQLAFTSFSPELSTDPYYDYSTTQTVLQIYQRDTSQASSEMGLSVLSNRVAPMLLQASTSWVQVPFYLVGQNLDFSETAWRTFTQVEPTPTPTPTPTQVPEPVCPATINLANPDGTISLRSQPNKESNQLKSLHHQDSVNIVGIFGDWYYIDHNSTLGWIGDRTAVKLAEDCADIVSLDNNGNPNETLSAYDYEISDEVPSDWESLTCTDINSDDDNVNLQNWTNCSRVVFSVYYRQFKAIKKRNPKISDLLAAVYKNEVSVLIRSEVATGIHSRNSVPIRDIAREAHRLNYWSVVYEQIPDCQTNPNCDFRMSISDITQHYLVQVQSWYQLANKGTLDDATITNITKVEIYDVVPFVSIGKEAVSQRWEIASGAPRQWGNYGYGKPSYNGLLSDNRVAYCYNVQQFKDNGDPTQATYPPDTWTDYNFVFITTRALDNKTSTYNVKFDFALRPPWLDQTQVINGQPNFYRNSINGTKYLDCKD